MPLGRGAVLGHGAAVERVSTPMHRAAVPIWLAVAAEGATTQMMLGNGLASTGRASTSPRCSISTATGVAVPLNSRTA
jgi:amidase